MLSIVSMVLTIGGLLGGIWAFKNGITRTATEVQERVINAMQQEIAILHLRIGDLERENRRLEQILSIICVALRQHGYTINVDGNFVTVSHGHESQSTHISPNTPEVQ
jgi:hypothetical protein